MEETRLGKIEVLPTAIASLSSQAVLECYGVVGMAPKDLAREGPMPLPRPMMANTIVTTKMEA